MSFILDALKKSESDRQQQGTAEFAAVPVSPKPPALPRWLWVVGVLLAINLVVLIGLLLRSDSAPAQPQQTPVANSDIATPPEKTGGARFEDQVAAARRDIPSQQENVDVSAPPKTSRDTIQSVLVSQNPASVSSSDLYPSLQEALAKGAFELADLHLDIHVYSDKPADRFVFINMSKHREGARLAEGPTVVEITPDGVVLKYQGQQFLLPRE